MTVQLLSGLGIIALSLAGWGVYGWLNRSAGRNEARLKADDETLRQVETGNDVANLVDALPDGAAASELQKQWGR